MKLHYLFIDGYRAYDKIDFYFTHELNVEFDGEKTFTVSRNENALPKNFFSISGKEDCPVQSVSALIGENGSGKTSLASFFYQMQCDSIDKGVRYVLLYSLKEGVRTQYYKCVNGNVEVVGDKFGIEFYKGYLTLLPPKITSMYYSPYVNFYSAFAGTNQDKGVVDLSSTAFVKQAITQSQNQVMVEKKDRFRDYEYNENEKVIRFLQAYFSESHCSAIAIDFRFPNGLKIRANTGIVDECNALLKNEQFKGKLEELCAQSDVKQKELCSFLGATRNSFFSKSVFKVFLSINIMQYLNGVPIDEEQLQKCIKLACMTSCKSKASDFRNKVIGYLNDNNDDVFRDFFNLMSELLQKEVSKSCDGDAGTLDVKLDCEQSPQSKEVIKKWLGLIASQPRFEGFRLLSVNFIPSMSSGEFAYLSLWGRLYDEVVCRQRVREDVVLFLDEVETTLHPKWQRDLVYNLIWFFETFSKSVQVHLIFTSHSPILLSDIPKENVTFLARNSDGKVHVLNDEVPLDNTFAANIFDLYSMSFFLKSGPVGAFAKAKIDHVLKFLSGTDLRIEDCFREKDNLRIVSKIVGDPFISAYLNNQMRGCHD